MVEICFFDLTNEIWNHQFSLEKVLNQQKNTKISRKILKNYSKSKKSTEKRQFWGTPSGSRPAFACRPALRSRQNHIFLFIFRRFLLISVVKSLKKLWNEQKRLKNLSTSFNQLLGARSTQKMVEIHNIRPLPNHLKNQRHDLLSFIIFCSIFV